MQVCIPGSRDEERQLPGPLNALTALLGVPTFRSRRIAGQSKPREHMATRAKLTALLGAVLAGSFVLVVGVVPANAHAGHDHGPAATVSSPEVLLPAINTAAGRVAETEDRGTRTSDQSQLADVPAKAPQPLHQGNCCCGSIACHAAVAALLIEVIPGYVYGMRLEPRPVSRLVGTKEGGIERPPRGVIPL
jgi:hypothetical protein